MIYLKKYKLAYIPVPKNACTTTKHFLYQLQNKREFESFEAGHKKFNIHNLMPTLQREKWNSLKFFDEIDRSNTFIFAIVRDPLSRLLSCYKNRVLFHGDISKDIRACKKCKEAGLPEKPDINTFAQNLTFYQENCKSIEHHSRPQVDFIGKDPNFYSKIYPIQNINSELWDDLNNIAGEKILTPDKKLQTGGSKIVIDQLTSENSAKIKHLYTTDYKFLGGMLD